MVVLQSSILWLYSRSPQTLAVGRCRAVDLCNMSKTDDMQRTETREEREAAIQKVTDEKFKCQLCSKCPGRNLRPAWRFAGCEVALGTYHVASL